MAGQALIVQGDALHLPLPDGSVDLVVTSPPYLWKRAYAITGTGELGNERDWREYLANLFAVTDEMLRVLKPKGSIFVNLGDTRVSNREPKWLGVPPKSRLLLPERYRVGCQDRYLDQGFIVRQVQIWEKANGLPESATDRTRDSHEDWVHLTKGPRYYSATDEIREATGDYQGPVQSWQDRKANGEPGRQGEQRQTTAVRMAPNPLGKLPGSVWTVPSEPLRLPDHLGVQHYACVDEQTEILTRRGWLTHTELQVGDEVAGYNLDTGLAEWTGCHAVHRYQHDGPMVAVEKRDLSMRLTTNHRTLVQRTVTRARLRGGVEVIEADQLGPQHFIPRSAEWASEPATKAIGEPLAALCGWIAAEGWHHGPSTYLSQSLTANPAKVEAIDALLARVEMPTAVPHGERWRQLLPLTRTERQRVYRGRPWTEVVWRLPLGLSQQLRRLMPDKRITAELANLPENERRALLDAFIDGDGHRRPDGRIGIFQQHRENLDWLQMIAVTLGYKTTLRPGSGRWVLFLTTGGRSITLRGTNGVNAPIPREHYRGIVWCPTTGTGTMICRRNGSVFVTGQSFPSEWPRRLILGFSPPGICVECGTGRVPVVERGNSGTWGIGKPDRATGPMDRNGHSQWERDVNHFGTAQATILGYACACTPHTNHPGSGEQGGWGSYDDAGLSGAPAPNGKQHVPGNYKPKVGPWREYHLDRWQAPPTRPAVVLDCFSGTGTTPMVARALGRIGIGVDLSHAYCRAARWRVYHDAAKAISRTNLERQGILL